MCDAKIEAILSAVSSRRAKKSVAAWKRCGDIWGACMLVRVSWLGSRTGDFVIVAGSAKQKMEAGAPQSFSWNVFWMLLLTCARADPRLVRGREKPGERSVSFVVKQIVRCISNCLLIDSEDLEKGEVAPPEVAKQKPEASARQFGFLVMCFGCFFVGLCQTKSKTRLMCRINQVSAQWLLF